MANAERNHGTAEMESVRRNTKKGTPAASNGLAIAGLRETVDGLEMRLDDVDERVAALELDASTDSSDYWEALARDALPQGEESVSVPIAAVPGAPAPGAMMPEGAQTVPASVADVQLPQPADQTGQENPHPSAEVRVALSDSQFEKLFGISSPRAAAVPGETTAPVIQVSPSHGSRSRPGVREG
jgi:hypothetical protein